MLDRTLPDIVEATKLYESWLSERIPLSSADLQLKHDEMARDSLRFFRATFYRWAQHWQGVAPELQAGPQVLSVGDLHVENFGTWRDSEGRLVWGVNDFDEAYPLSWSQDLVRLATSAHLAIEEDNLLVARGEACTAILDGYTTSLKAGGCPFILAERHGFLRKLALGKARAPRPFWAKLATLPDIAEPPLPGALAALDRAPEVTDGSRRFVHRISGLGSLGRPRYVALAESQRALIAREAKALVASACRWAIETSEPETIFYQVLLDSAVRDRDPFVQINDGWVVRRLAPDCDRFELKQLPRKREEHRLLWSMGYECGNIHL